MKNKMLITLRLPALQRALHARFFVVAAVLLVLAAANHAHAATAEADDQNFFRIGGERAIFHDQNAGFQGPGIPAGAHLETQVEDLSAVFLSYARGFTPHVELELQLGIPPDFKAHARGPASVGSVPYAGVPLTNGKVMSPSATLNYKFNEPGGFYRPFVGAGLVYSHFYDIHDTPGTDAINGGPTKINFTDSFGLLVVAGVSFHLAEHLYAQLSVSKADVRPDVTTETAGIKRTNHIDLGPIVFIGALSYGF